MKFTQPGIMANFVDGVRDLWVRFESFEEKRGSPPEICLTFRGAIPVAPKPALSLV